ncbi:hypothetical protein BRC20_00735 [Candidatus Saccharibacteria bacterium QS_8_54_8]|nr:MAG: hypothetical protein BRC20_00735 [Candidatus Saccharibacteria bacterium QS_8_54_8]
MTQATNKDIPQFQIPGELSRESGETAAATDASSLQEGAGTYSETPGAPKEQVTASATAEHLESMEELARKAWTYSDALEQKRQEALGESYAA